MKDYYHQTFLRFISYLLNSERMFTVSIRASFIALDMITLVKNNNLVEQHALIICKTNFSSSWKRFNVCHNKLQVPTVAFRQRVLKPYAIFTYNNLQ